MLAVVFILAGCTGGKKSDVQTVVGKGFTFSAPVGWTVERKPTVVAASSGAVSRIEVSTFTLVKPYRPALFDASSRELDKVATELASQIAGEVVSSSTVSIGGRKARSYVVDYGETKSMTIAFVLQGKREYELLCRRTASQPDTVCAAFFESFTLKSSSG